MYLNRTLCDVLEEMRKATTTLNFGHLAGLIEEAQTFSNRMEAALADRQDEKQMHEKLKALNNEVKTLEARRDALVEEVNQ